MIRRPPRSTRKESSAASDVYKRQREAYNYIQAKQLKCNIITMPEKIINQIDAFGKSSKLMTLDTVKGFLSDSKKSKFNL